MSTVIGNTEERVEGLYEEFWRLVQQDDLDEALKLLHAVGNEETQLEMLSKLANANSSALARALEVALTRDVSAALTFELDLALDLDIALDRVLNLAFDLNLAIELASALRRTLDLALGSDQNSTFEPALEDIAETLSESQRVTQFIIATLEHVIFPLEWHKRLFVET